MEDFKRSMPGVEKWKKKVVEEARARQPPHVVTIAGRRRYLPSIALGMPPPAAAATAAAAATVPATAPVAAAAPAAAAAAEPNRIAFNPAGQLTERGKNMRSADERKAVNTVCQAGWDRLLAPSLFALKPSLRVMRDAEGPHVIGRVRDLLRFPWLEFLARFAPILNVNVDGP